MNPMFRPTLGDLKNYVTCKLCGQYLSEATTINKCFHSFCHRCIVSHLSSNISCPTCNKLLHPKRPLSKIRRDRILQRLVYKIVPGLLKRPEVNDSCKELDQDPAEPLFSTSDYLSICLEQKSRSCDVASSSSESDSGVFPLASEDHKVDEMRYLLCAAVMKLKILKKFLCFKFDLTSQYEVEVVCSNRLYDDEHSLLDIAYISKWPMVEPLKLEYLILDKEKLSSEPEPLQLKTDEPLRLAALSDEVPVPPGPDPTLPSKLEEPLPDESAPISDTPTATPSALLEPGNPEMTSGSEISSVKHCAVPVKTKKGKKRKSQEVERVESAEGAPPVGGKKRPDKATGKSSASKRALEWSAREKKPSKKRGKKRKSDGSRAVCSNDAKSNSVIRCRSVSQQRHKNSIPPSTKSPDTTSGEARLSSKDNRVTSGDEEQTEQVQTHSRDDQSVGNCGRVAPIKISLDGRQLGRTSVNRTSPLFGRATEASSLSYVEKSTYELQRKDDMRMQLSRKPPQQQQPEKEMEEKHRSKTSSRKTKKSKSKGKGERSTGKKRMGKSECGVGGVKIIRLDVGHPGLASDEYARIVSKQPSIGVAADDEVYQRPSSARKKRFPSITVTPSPVVFDTEIVTSPYGVKKASKLQRRKSLLAKIPKAISISTIPPTFVLTSVRTPDNEKNLADDREPKPLKLCLKMVDERKAPSAQEAADDCFMVSSTVADEEADLGCAGSGNSSSGSPRNNGVTAEDRKPVQSSAARQEGRTETTSLSVVDVGRSSDGSHANLSSLYPAENRASKELSVEVSGCFGVSRGEPSQGKSAVLPVGSSPSGTPDRGQKRKRLESVISSLKPVASVTVLTDSMPSVSVAKANIPDTAVGREQTRVVASTAPVRPKHSAQNSGSASKSLLHQLVSREPLNIPVPPVFRSWRQPMGVQPQFPPFLLNRPAFPVRPNGPFREPLVAPRQRRPRCSRRGAGQATALRYPSANSQYGIGLLPVVPRGWQPSPHRLGFALGYTVPGGRAEVSRFQPEANGYDAPLELTTRKSRDSAP